MHTEFWVSVLPHRLPPPTYPRHWLAVRPSHPWAGQASKALCVHVFLSRRAQSASRPVRLLSGRRGSDPIRRLPLRSSLPPGTGALPMPMSLPRLLFVPLDHARAGRAQRAQVAARSRPPTGAPVLSLGLVTNRCEYFLEKETEMQVGPSYSTPVLQTRTATHPRTCYFFFYYSSTTTLRQRHLRTALIHLHTFFIYLLFYYTTNK